LTQKRESWESWRFWWISSSSDPIQRYVRVRFLLRGYDKPEVWGKHHRMVRIQELNSDFHGFWALNREFKCSIHFNVISMFKRGFNPLEIMFSDSPMTFYHDWRFNLLLTRDLNHVLDQKSEDIRDMRFSEYLLMFDQIWPVYCCCLCDFAQCTCCMMG
jgi:hypothetical protein